MLNVQLREQNVMNVENLTTLLECVSLKKIAKQMVANDDEEEEDLFVGAVTKDHKTTEWNVEVKINNQKIVKLIQEHRQT